MGKVDNTEINKAEARILKWLPPDERDAAKRLIYKAVKQGFTNLELCVWGAETGIEPSVRDIMATDRNNVIGFLYGKI